MKQKVKTKLCKRLSNFSYYEVYLDGRYIGIYFDFKTYYSAPHCDARFRTKEEAVGEVIRQERSGERTARNIQRTSEQLARA